MSKEKLDQIERMISELILSVRTIKSIIEEEREENQRRFTQLEKQNEEMLKEIHDIKRDQKYMGMRIFQTELDLHNVKEAFRK